MLDLKKSYLVPFDPDDTGEPFGFMRANINGRDQWWLVQVWADDDSDDTVWVRFLDQDGPGEEFEDMAEGFRGRPWYPIPWINDDVPRKHSPAFRLALDMPGGVRITHEWGPDGIGEVGQKTAQSMLDKAFRGLVDG